MNTQVERKGAFTFYSKMPTNNGHLFVIKYNIIYSVETWWRLLKQVIKFNIFHDGTGWHQTPPDMIH